MSMTIQEKYQKLCDRLYEKTLDGSIQWATDIINEDAVFCVIGKSTIEISEGRNEQHSPIITVSIRADNGRIVESFTDEELMDVTVTYGRFDSYWQLMGEILVKAKRQISGVDAVIDDILEKLEDTPF